MMPNDFFSAKKIGSLSVVDEGAGEPILFSHGTPTWSYEYRHLIRALSATHRCIAPDHLGFGRSERPANEAYTPEAHADRFLRLFDELDLQDVTLVIHDFGGPIAGRVLFERAARIKRVVVFNSFLWAFDESDDQMLGRAAILGGVFGRFLYGRLNVSLKMLMPLAYGDTKKLTKDVHRVYLEPFEDRADRVRVLHPLAASLIHSRQYFASLWTRRWIVKDTPALLVWGMKDPAFTKKHLAQMKEVFPSNETVELPGAGHWPHEEEPQTCLEAVRAFVDAGGAVAPP